MTIEEFYEGATDVVKNVDAFVHKHDLKNFAQADHICYKCGSTESFERMREMLEGESEYIHQAIISGRRIAYIKLKKSVATDLGEIAFLELSDQKPDGSQHDGFEHIEIFPLGISYDDLVAKLESRGEVLKKTGRPHHTSYDLVLDSGFQIRLEPEALIEKIKSEEM
jgi:predicted metalloenzyme YecM